MAEREAKKILGNVWASDSDALIVDPEDGSLDPPLNRAQGWTARFSAGTQRLRAPVWNQRFKELDQTASDLMRFGVLAYDAEVDYPRNSYTHTGSSALYRAVRDNGPVFNNVEGPDDVGQTSWETLVPSSRRPAQTRIPTAIPGNGTLEVSWHCPLNNGAVLTQFVLQWRLAGTAAWTNVQTLRNVHTITGLDNGSAYEVRVRGDNAQGQGDWSPILISRPQAGAPDQVRGVLSIASDSQVELQWNQPSANGGTIVHYRVQWHAPGESFSASQELVFSGLIAIIRGLTNGQQYQFRVRAESQTLEGGWSSQVQETPVAPIPPPPPLVANTVPDNISSSPVPTLLSGTDYLWEWTVPLSGKSEVQEGGQQISRFDFQIRKSGEEWEDGTTYSSVASCVVTYGLDGAATYQARVKAVNAVGLSVQWSPVAFLNTPIPIVPNFRGVIEGDSVRWTWSVIPGIGRYQLQTRQLGTTEFFWRGFFLSGSTVTHSTTIRVAGSPVQGRIRGQIGSRSGPWDEIHVTVVAASPRNLASSSTVLNKVKLTWDAPAVTGGAASLQYDLQWRLRGSTNWTLIQNINGTEQTVTASNTIEWRVRTRNDAGVSGWTSIAVGRVLIQQSRRTSRRTFRVVTSSSSRLVSRNTSWEVEVTTCETVHYRTRLLVNDSSDTGDGGGADHYTYWRTPYTDCTKMKVSTSRTTSFREFSSGRRNEFYNTFWDTSFQGLSPS